MKSLAEYFQAFHRYAVENELSASSRSLYYTILGMINANYWKEDRVSTSVRDMQVLGGFQSSSVVERAKAVLGTENIVKINKLKNRKTEYQLVEPQYWARNTSGTPAEHLRDTSKTPAEHLRDTAYSIYPSSNVRKDDEDRKTMKTEKTEGNAPEREDNRRRKICQITVKFPVLKN